MQPTDTARLLALRDWLPGQVLKGTRGAQYHLRERVGEGGQGWVFSASWDEPGGYVVIVKVLRPDVITPESFARFEREAQVLRMLGQAARPNPHVVRFFDHATARLSPPSGGEPIDLPFTVLEYVRGSTLEQVLAQSPGMGMPLERTRRIARQIVLALEDVHAHNVVHRDLKPSNVLLATEGGAEVAKVTDFGLVKLIDIGLGRTTALAGATLGYAPPEQFEQGNRRVTLRTDLFSFAALLYEMLTGAKAFPHNEGENPLVVVTRLLNGPRPSLSRARGVLPRELAMRPDLVELLDALVIRATAAEPSERPASIGELWAGIEPLLRSASRRPSPPAGIAAANDMSTAIDLPTPPPGATPARHRPGEVRHLESRPPSAPPNPGAEYARPAAWTWRVRIPPIRAAAVRAAVFDPGGEAAVAVGEGGLLLWQGSGWIQAPPASEMDARAVRGMAWLWPGELVVFGAHGLAARLVPGAGLETWPGADREVTFLAAHVDAPGTTVTLVGERAARRAVRGGAKGNTTAAIAQFVRGKLMLLSEVPECSRLGGVTRLRAGEIVCCGDWGALVRVELGVPHYVGSICGGHLHAIAALVDGGAIVAGAGGHALSLSARLQAQLEAVQTTRDLLALAVDSGGIAWAGSAQARLLRRTAGSWVRMSAELGLSSSVVALWAESRAVRAICDDGAVIEGIVPDDHIDR
jgi:eukaryotic-like serine/threonine-protein kinase